jgi:hypothetical protein
VQDAVGLLGRSLSRIEGVLVLALFDHLLEAELEIDALVGDRLGRLVLGIGDGGLRLGLQLRIGSSLSRPLGLRLCRDRPRAAEAAAGSSSVDDLLLQRHRGHLQHDVVGDHHPGPSARSPPRRRPA